MSTHSLYQPNCLIKKFLDDTEILMETGEAICTRAAPFIGGQCNKFNDPSSISIHRRPLFNSFSPEVKPEARSIWDNHITITNLGLFYG